MNYVKEEINIKIHDFEGPLDLLLHLVNQYKVDIYEVPLVEVITQLPPKAFTLCSMRASSVAIQTSGHAFYAISYTC